MKRLIALSPILAAMALLSALQVSRAQGVVGGDVCNFTTKTSLAFSQAASAQLLTGVAGRRTFICGILIHATAAEVVSLVSGTGVVCAGTPAALIGSTTVAQGPSLADKSSLNLGSGNGTVAIAATATNICLLQAATSRLSGVLTYVRSP